jgi:hypothetical protein
MNLDTVEVGGVKCRTRFLKDFQSGVNFQTSHRFGKNNYEEFFGNGII